MLYYLLLISADILLAAFFVINKYYQKSEGSSLTKGLIFNAVLGAFSSVMFFAANGFRIDFSLFSLFMAFGQAALIVGYTVIGFKIMSDGNVSTYTLFLMTGGMIVPFVWGVIFLGEPLTVLRTAGVIIIALAIALSNKAEKKVSTKTLIMLIAIFFINGFTSVIAKEHQISAMAISTGSFCVYNSLGKTVLSLFALPFVYKKGNSSFPKSKKSYFFIILAAIASGVSYFFQLVGAAELPATVTYPVITGGSIIFTSLAARIFFSERINKRTLISIGFCFVGTLMFL